MSAILGSNYNFKTFSNVARAQLRCLRLKMQSTSAKGAAGLHVTSMVQHDAGADPAGGPWHAPLKPRGVIPRTEVQGSHDWTGLYKSQADQPIPDPDLRLELVKTGYLIQAAYKYLTDFREYAAAYDGLPMGNIPGITIPRMPGNHPAAAAASRYRLPDDEDGFITLATAGIYPGEAFELFQGKILSTNPIGYVAISEDKRDIAVVFRGTSTAEEWISNFTDLLSSWDEIDETAAPRTGRKLKDSVWVEKGFETMYRRFVSTPGDSLSLQGQVQKAVKILLTAHKNVQSITVCGHSLGGALASMCAFDLASSEINKVGGESDGELIPVTCYTWEAPRVGNVIYARKFGDFVPNNTYLQSPQQEREQKPYVNMFRVVNVDDLVPKVPVAVFRPFGYLTALWRTIAGLVLRQEDNSEWTGFHHGGTEVEVNLKYAWDNPQSGIEKPQSFQLDKFFGEAHSLWNNMWLIDHGVQIPTSSS